MPTTYSLGQMGLTPGSAARACHDAPWPAMVLLVGEERELRGEKRAGGAATTAGAG